MRRVLLWVQKDKVLHCVQNDKQGALVLPTNFDTAVLSKVWVVDNVQTPVYSGCTRMDLGAMMT
jgi:hypothetical protein